MSFWKKIAYFVVTALACVISVPSHAGSSEPAQRIQSFVSGSIDVQNISKARPINVLFENNEVGTHALGVAVKKIGYDVRAQGDNTVRATIAYFGTASGRPAFGAIENGKTYGSKNLIDGFNAIFSGNVADTAVRYDTYRSIPNPLLVVDLVGRATGVAGLFNGLFSKSSKKDPIVSMIVELQTPFAEDPVYILVESLEQNVTADEMLNVAIEKVVWFLST